MLGKSLLVALTAGTALFGGAASATAAAPSAAVAPRTTALEFADGLGMGQKVAHAEDDLHMRSVENLEILSEEFRLGYGGVPLPVTVAGISDSNNNGLDDDSLVTISVFGSSACLILGSQTYYTAPGSCGISVAASHAVSRSAKGVDAARRWRVSSENAWAEQGFGVRIVGWNLDALNASLTELRGGVRVTGLTDSNHDNADDDGKLQFSSSAGKACLHLGKSLKVASTVTYGAC